MRISEQRASMPGRPPATKIHSKLKDDEIEYKKAILLLRTQMSLNQSQFARQFNLNGENARYTVGRWERLSCPDLPGRENMKRMRVLFQMNAGAIELGEKVDFKV